MNPTQEVLEFLTKRSPRILGKPLKECTVLDVFAGDGSKVAKDYLPLVGFPELWERDKSKEDALITLINKHKGGQVVITDSYEWIKKPVRQRYDLIIVDNFLMGGDHIEHFDLFPHVFSVLEDRAYLMLFIVGNPDYYLQSNPRKDEVLPKIQVARNEFYRLQGPGDPTKAMLDRYTELAGEAGYEVTWSIFTQRASNTAHWLTLELVKKELVTEELKTKIVPLKGTAHLIPQNDKDLEEQPPEPKLTTKLLKVRKSDDQTDYFELIESINARIITFDEQLSLPNVDERHLVIRHDVDDDIDKALLFAFAEQAHGIRSTYFILPTAKYFDYSDELGKKLCDMVRLGHEIGYHNNALAMWLTPELRDGYSLEGLINKHLGWIRSLGIEVKGTASHGDSLCRVQRFNNYEVWEECPEKSRQKLKGYFPCYPLAQFFLNYEAYFVRRDAYLSESGSRWYGATRGQIPKFEVYDQTDLRETIEAFNKMDAGILQLLVHPQWWSVEL